MNFSQRLIAHFIDSKITPLLILIATLIGIVAIVGLPREEEPQINVTMIDVSVSVAATPAREVEQRVCRPLEKLLKELPGVEYVYTTAMENECLVSLRFYVDYSPLKAITEARTQIDENIDVLAAGASEPILSVRNIDE